MVGPIGRAVRECDDRDTGTGACREGRLCILVGRKTAQRTQDLRDVITAVLAPSRTVIKAPVATTSKPA